MIDFVHPATTHDEPIVTLHSLLDRDVYRGGAIVVGPVRRGRGRRVRVERRVVPVSADSERRLAILERELWRIAVENLNYSEQHAWAALAGARVAPNGWRRAKAMLQHDETKELRRRFLLTCVQRNRNRQLRLKALAEIAALRDPDAFDEAVDMVGDAGRATSAAPAPRRCCRRSPSAASAAATRPRPGSGGSPRTPASCTRSTRCSAGRRPSACWACSSTPRAARTGETRAGSSTPPATRTAGSPSRCWPPRVAHTPEAEEALRGARMRMARKPSAVARELLRNFPKGGKRRRQRRRKGSNGEDRRREGERRASRADDGRERHAATAPM